jgi:hypothetical protein
VIAARELVDRLQFDLTRKTYSFTEYITISSPYIPPGKEEMWDLLLQHRQQNREQARRLSRIIVDLGGIPQPGLYNEGAADTNYLSIIYLYNVLVRTIEGSVRATQERITQAEGYPAVRQLMEAILAEERKQHSEVSAMLEKHRPAPPVAAPVAAAQLKQHKPAAAAPGAEGEKNGGFDLQSFLAKKGGAKAPADRKPEAEAAPKEVEEKPTSPGGFDLQSFLAKKAAKSEAAAPEAKDTKAPEPAVPAEPETPPAGNRETPPEAPDESAGPAPDKAAGQFDVQQWLKNKDKK